MNGILSRRLPGSWTITLRQLTENVELAVVAFGQLQQRLCRRISLRQPWQETNVRRRSF